MSGAFQDPALPEFEWMAIFSVFVAFVMAFGIGANDVANAFGSSVAAKSLTLAQVMVIASIMEFSGAILIGASVTSTIRSKIIDKDFYEDVPELLMFGMLSALIVASSWLLLATYLEFPVSTTHDIIACIIGFSLAARGWDSVDWKTVRKLMMSWIISPVFSGTISFILYTPLKKFVMEHEHSFERAVFVYPVVVFIGFAGNLFYLLYKFNNYEMSDYDWGRKVVLPVSIGGGVIMAGLTFFILGPIIKNRVEEKHNEHLEAMKQAVIDNEKSIEDAKNADKLSEEEVVVVDVDDPPVAESKKSSFEGHTVLKDPVSGVRKTNTLSLHNAFEYFADNTYRQDLQTMSLNENAGAKNIWNTSVSYDERTEWMFSYLQVFTACLASFAHGGNDVANAIAPASAVLSIYKEGEFKSKSEVQKWILAMGGAALACGFIFFGYRIIKSVGYKLTCITPSRGLCIELAAALAVSTASFLELPVSTTQCLVGSTAGVGLASGGPGQVQWKYLARTMCGWIFFFFSGVIISAGFFSYSIYSPSFYGVSK